MENENDILGNQFFQLAKYEVGGVFLALKVSIARPDAIRILRPAGQPIPFCEAVRTTSSFQSSNLISSDPTLQTPSTMTNVSGLTLCTSSLNALISLSTPVEVSTCVTVMSLYFFSLSAFSISGSCGRSPIGALSCVAFAPYVCKQSANESAK